MKRWHCGRIAAVAICLGVWYTIWKGNITDKFESMLHPTTPLLWKWDIRTNEPAQKISCKSNNHTNISKLSKINRTEGYLVYDCSHRWPGSCGGWSDRLSGILSTYILAIITNRKFLINFDNPCLLQDYFELHDWSYNKTLVGNKTSKNYYLKDDSGRKIMNILTNAISVQPIKNFFTAEVSFVRINWDMTPEFRKFLHVEKYVPWITELHYADIHRYIFELFLHPKPFLTKIADSVFKSKQTKTSFCAHVRIGRSSTLPNDNVRTKAEDVNVILDFIKTIDKTKHDLLLATDSVDLQRQFTTNYSNNFLLKVPGRITHIDQTKTGDTCDGFQRQLLDFLLLSKCDKLVVCESGFSIMAAYLRDISDGLYCWTRRSVVPCSRYTIHDFFPKPLIGPPR
ncbi:uncharacterized protein [Argopecten irradians]|uniref:uncharacterized protein n=1 Tax=Argopecten irradians TaxID=31199 RepID=UPI00372482ED